MDQGGAGERLGSKNDENALCASVELLKGRKRITLFLSFLHGSRKQLELEIVFLICLRAGRAAPSSIPTEACLFCT